jgi:hypothetical protein
MPHSGRRFALLLRGEAFRAGCTPLGVQLQLNISSSQRRLLIEPLEQRGHCVDVLLSLNNGCHGEERLNAHAVAALQLSHGHHLRATQQLNVRSQGQAVRGALSLFNASGGGDIYDHLLLIRHDILVRTHPRCDLSGERMLFAGPCEGGVAARFGASCVQDTFIAVPHRMLSLLHDALVQKPWLPAGRSVPGKQGRQGDAGVCGCFDDGCLRPSRHLRGNGHNCLSRMRSIMVQGPSAAKLEFGLCSRRATSHEMATNFYGSGEELERARRVSSEEVNIFDIGSKCLHTRQRCLGRMQRRQRFMEFRQAVRR